MFVFYSFGQAVLYTFLKYWNIIGIFMFLFLYFSAIVISAIFSTLKHKDNPYYTAVGASVAVSAISFSLIFFYPWEKILFFGILPIPAIIFGAIFLIYSYIMGKRSADNIGHDAHFWGAVYGLAFPIILKPQLIKYFIFNLISL
jgi:membrane associated rhomboid family serine protease